MKNWLAAVCIFSIACAAGLNCKDPVSDEEQIQALIRNASELAEKHQLGDLMDLVTQDFSIRPKGWNRKQTKMALLLVFRKLGVFSIYYPSPEIVINPKGMLATASVTFLLLRKGEPKPELEAFEHDPENWLQKVGNRAKLQRVQLNFIKQDDQWMVQEARFEYFRGLGFGP